MKSRSHFPIAIAASVLIPILTAAFVTTPDASARFPGWIDQWDGAPLKRLPFTWRERRFADGFPGQAAHFTDGTRSVLLRYSEQATWRLHSGLDCFRQAGFAVKQLPDYTDTAGRRWSHFEAAKFGESVRVSERIVDRDGRQWTRARSWYWPALLGRSAGPWWAVTLIEKKEGPRP